MLKVIWLMSSMKLVLITFGGRKSNLEILFNYIIKYRKYINTYYLYVATAIQSDIDYMESLTTKYEFVKTIYTYKDGKRVLDDKCLIWDLAYSNCQDHDTVYIKLDDDIVFLEESLFTDFVKFRIENPDAPLIYPVMINNIIISWKLQERGIINPSVKSRIGDLWPIAFKNIKEYIQTTPGHVFGIQTKLDQDNLLCPIAWGTLKYCYDLHNQFINDIASDNISKYKSDNWCLENSEPASICCVSWLGSGLKSYVEKYGPVSKDEQWWSVFVPTWSGNPNVVYGNTIVSHYSYYRQRELGLDSTDILPRYYILSCNT